MLKNTKDLYGIQLAASDGGIGRIKDFYFDDKIWVVRYLVADTGTWLTGRQVLLAPHAFGRLDQDLGLLHMKLTRAQIESSPSIETHRPVSRQYEIDYYRYYGWPGYWNGGAMWGLGAYPAGIAPIKDEVAERFQHLQRDDKHLRSTQGVTSYGIQSIDGPIGNVTGMMVDDTTWAVKDIVVDAGHWYSGKEILISTKKVVRIGYEESKVFVSLTKEDIRDTEANELARSGSEALGSSAFRD